MKTISPAELHRLVGAQSPGAALPILDVRTPVEFDEVHAEGARNVPLNELDPKALYAANALPAGQPVYLLCRSGTRAGHAADKFAAQGYETAVVVEGGTVAWEQAALPVKRGAAASISLERQVRIAAGALVLTGVLLGYFVHYAFIWLAAFVGGGLVFAGITDWCGMGLLIAKAPWNQRRSA
jgi:rhodanese-related sulfurtransferase